MTYVRVFLKICEGCGALWLRSDEGKDVYCGRCARRMQELPPPRPKRRGGRPRLRRAAHVRGGAA
jgi:hypothetical protein